MTPAEELRTAAKTIREKAAAVRDEFRTSFYWGNGEVTWADGINNACGGAGGELAALFGPAAAEPLAAWLEEIATEAERHEAKGWGNLQAEIAGGWPLEVARAITEGAQ